MTIQELKDKYIYRDYEAVYEGYKTIPLEEKDGGDEGLIHFAVSVADAKALKILIERGVDVNEIGRYNYRPFHILAQCASRNKIEDVIDCANLLLDNKASVIRKNDMGETPVFIASRENILELIEIFVERNLKLHFTDNNGNTPLHIAVDCYDSRDEERSIKIIQLLLQAEADVELKNNYGNSPIDLALNKLKNPKIVAILKGEYDFENPDSPQNLVAGMSLHFAILNRNYDAIKAHLELGADINEISDEDNNSKFLTPLGIACYILDFETVKLLAEKRVDVNLKNNEGETALATWFKYLGSRYFDYNAADNKIVEKIVKLLIENGLNINDVIDENGNTLFLKATEFINNSRMTNGSSIPLQVLNVLLKEKIDINFSNLEGQTALMNLCKYAENNNIDFIIELLEDGADVGAVDKNGNTAIMYAAKNLEMNVGLEISKLLYEFGDVKLNHVNNDGYSLMDIATENNNENLVNWILTKL